MTLCNICEQLPANFNKLILCPEHRKKSNWAVKMTILARDIKSTLIKSKYERFCELIKENKCGI